MLPLLLAAALQPVPPDGDPVIPGEWLVIGPLDARGRRPFRPDAVFARYLLEPGPVPVEGEELSGSEGSGAWERVEGGGRVAMPGRGAYAHATLEVEEAGVYLAELRRATTLFVNGEATAGDVYGYGFEGYPVALRKGRNDLFVTGARGGFTLELVPVEEGLSFAPRDRTVPDVLRTENHWVVGLLVRNATTRPVEGLDFTLAGPEHIERGTLRPIEPTSLLALGLGRVAMPVRLDFFPTGVDALEISVVERSRGLEAPLSLRVREPEERRRRTYESDVDRSAQEYVVNPPVGEHDGPMRLVLSLHGAGVGAWGQASSYAPKPDFWVVAPTNRREFGFDWQDWGRLDAYDVLREARRLSGVDERYLYVSGHSMGGHGTWHLAANDPDTFAACGPSAGWATFDSYGGRPEQRDTWLRADGASRTLDLVDNLKQVPPYILHGTRDRNVPPEQAHTMIEALTAADATFEAHFEGGAGHWWGSRCVDWPPLFDHFRAHEKPAEPTEIEFVTVDPSVDSQHEWVRIEQPLEYGRSSWIRGELTPEGVAVDTRNVRMLQVWRAADEVILDGESVGGSFEGLRARSFVRTSDGWSSEDPEGQKSADSSGPFKRAFDREFLLVVGTRGGIVRDRVLLARARHDAAVWTYRGSGNAPVLTDTQYLGFRERDRNWKRNVILYGNRDDNEAWEILGDSPPVDFQDGVASVGERRFEGDYAGVFVQPGDGFLVGAFASTSTRAARLGDTFAPFISGVGYPDYAVVGLDVLTHGDDAVVAAGWFDHAWEIPE